MSTLQIKKHSLSRNGFALNLVSCIDEAASAAEPHPYPDILLIHGLTYSSHQFDLNIEDYSLVRYLANQGFRVWRLDITGYGESEKPEDGFLVDSDYAAKDIHAATDYILQHENTDKLNLLGWSWGTITASRFAVKHPERLNKLILFAPIIYGLDYPPQQTDYEPFSATVAKSYFEGHEIDPAVEAAYLAQTAQFDGAGSPGGGRRDLFQSKDTQLIPFEDIQTPTLFIAGDADFYLPHAQQDLTLLLQHAPAGSRKTLIPGAGHALFLEKPYYQVFQQAILAFL